MADSFFGFNTSLTGLELVDEPELDEEEEYDALNDETFGADAFQGDWEEDHTRFAEVAENSRTYRNSFNSEKDDDLDLEASLSQLVLESEEEGEDEEVENEARNKTSKQSKFFNKFSLDYIGDYSSSPAWSVHSKGKILNSCKKQPLQPFLTKPSVTHFLPPQLPKIPTVQELEKDFIQKNKQNKYVDKENKNKEINQTFYQNKNHYPAVSNNNKTQNSNSSNQFQNLNVQQQNAQAKFTRPGGSNKIPPGFGPLQQSHFNQPQQKEMVMLRNNQNMPMQLGPLILPSHLPMLLSPHILPPPPPHPLLMVQNPRMMNPHSVMRFMPNHPLLMQLQQQQQQQHQKQMYQKQQDNKLQNNQDFVRNGHQSRNHHNSNFSQHPWMHNPNRRNNGNYDEYAGLMNNRERQWLLNIQIIQLASDKPHLNDYYYMAWSKKQEKKLKENNLKNEKQNREPFFANNRQPKNDLNHWERRDSDRELISAFSPRVYVPLQFENSLGKLQCGSVTAPRKIIDLDVVPERQIETTPITNQRDSRKTKKILLELEKLYLLVMDIEDIGNNLIPESDSVSEESPPSKPKLLENIMTSYLSDDRFVNFMCIRKGKTLILRVFPHLNFNDHIEYLNAFWCRFFKSISIIIRRDLNDGILLQMYSYFKQWISTINYSVLSIISSDLLAANVLSQGKKSSRAVSPVSGKSVLSFILTTTFGVSVVCCILSRGETLFATIEEKEKQDWSKFILNFVKQLINLPNLENQISTPMDSLPANVVTVILNRSTGLHIQDYASAKRILTAFNK